MLGQQQVGTLHPAGGGERAKTGPIRRHVVGKNHQSAPTRPRERLRPGSKVGATRRLQGQELHRCRDIGAQTRQQRQ
ncbi:MAG: hypothetical protein CAPSK01_002425 [Candidatus Accumulibacter vicinus]|uniref:Uncharacterized protein n=1 Tax=Candidatus Accumulibacter vicinus TaxID=2954382 RepID=A0A084XZE3_9PROT|nr:MAG: hypothetical protein CAPSK01_002425 [Candidatus Accumulibacter vicinus]